MTSRARPRWWPHVPPLVADSLLALGLALLAVYEFADPGDDGHQAGPLWLNAPLSGLLLAPLVMRRRAPMAALLFACAVVAVPSILVDHTLFAFSGSFVTGIYLYTVARHRDWRSARWAPPAIVVMIAVYSIRAPATVSPGNVIFGVLVYGLCWATGRVLRRYAVTQAALTDALAQLGRDQEQRELLAVNAERSRVARDLHDVVAHAVALMVVQSGAARLALDDDLGAARGGLLAVERIGREATGDLRRLLGLLRSEHDSDGLTPAPGLGQLQALTRDMSMAGLEIEFEVFGDCPPLSPSLNLSAYRVVQEALTNVLKHAGATTVRVRVEYGDAIRIAVIDSGPRAARTPVASSGHGLLGMRERVALFGGRCQAGRHEGGFAVHVELPLSG